MECSKIQIGIFDHTRDRKTDEQEIRMGIWCFVKKKKKTKTRNPQIGRGILRGSAKKCNIYTINNNSAEALIG